jgi:hypothetical protein
MSFLSSSSPSYEGPHTLQSHLNKRSLLTKTGLFDIPHDNLFDIPHDNSVVAVQGVKEHLKLIYRKIFFCFFGNTAGTTKEESCFVLTTII